MGAGFHGGSGLKVPKMDISGPLLLYLGCCMVRNVNYSKKKDIENLENFQRKCLKQIQGLPDNTSNSACLALLGILPIESVLHQTLLSKNISNDQELIQSDPTSCL